ncbi:TonB-dependent siderophore receptor [Parapedobacter luteus]|nr:TonB-dependent siderophore receptor [Parapedobacter luteus]
MNFLRFNHSYVSITAKTLAILSAALLCAAASYAQSTILQKRISIQRAETTLAQALASLEAEAGCTFIYSPDLLDTDRKVSLRYQNQPLEAILADLLGDAVRQLEVTGNRITLQPSRGKGTVSGMVMTNDGQPAALVTVAIRGGRSARTDEQGRYRLENVESGDHIIVASYVGLTPVRKQVYLAPGGAAKADFVLDENAQSLQEVVVTGQKRFTSSVTKSDVPLENLPMMVQIIDQSLLEQRQITSIREAVSSVSGVTYASSFAGGYDTFTGRGFGLNIMRNGVAVTNSAGQLYGDNIEQIDVLKGPASIQYGDIAPGSVMNLVTKKPLDYNYKRFELKLGQYNLFRPTVDISGPLNDSKTVLFRLNSSLEKSESFRDEINNRSFLFAPTITWKITPKLIWNVEGVYYNDARTTDPGIISPDGTYDGLSRLRFATFLGEPANVYRNTDENLFSTLEYQLNDRWKFRNVTYYTNATREYGWMSFTLASLTESGDIDRTYSSETGQYGGRGSTVDVLGRITLGSTDHHLLVGGEYLYDDRDRSLSGWGTLDKPINLYHPVYGQSTLILDNQGTPGDPSTQRKRLGVYVQDQIALLDEKLQFLLGVRLNRVERASTWSTGVVPDQYLPDKQTIFNPRFGILVKPVPWLSAFASYTNSFEMNGQNRFTGELLDPSDAHQYEAGLKSSLLNDHLGITLAAFHIDKKNISGYVSGLTEPPTFAHTYYSPESGTASYIGANHRSKGLELDINGRILPQVYINGAFSYIDATIVADPAFPAGNQLPGSPKFIANVWAGYEFLSGSLAGLNLSTGYSFRSSNYATGYNLPTQEAPSYTTVDVSIGYRLQPFFARLNVTNLFDAKSYTYGMYGGYYPLWSRRAVLSIGIKL